MLLKLKNAASLALRNVIDKTIAAGGVVKHIELSSKEAFDLLREINENKNIRKHYSYIENDKSIAQLCFRLNGADAKQIDVIANEWYKRKIGINFVIENDEYPLYIVVPRVKKELSKKFSRYRKPLTNK